MHLTIFVLFLCYFRHAIYLTRDGRISMAGVNGDNAATIAAAIVAVTG